jgi:hypothetical protein
LQISAKKNATHAKDNCNAKLAATNKKLLQLKGACELIVGNLAGFKR